MNDITINIDDYIDTYEKAGAELIRPVLNAGNYKAAIVELTTRTLKFTYKKGKNVGQEGVMTSWGVKLALESETAQQVLKQDNDIFVYADNDCINIGTASLNCNANVGITMDNNGKFWSFVGNILSQVGLATKKQDDSGVASFIFDRSILEAVYKNIPAKKAELEESSDYDELLLPGLLADYQVKQLSELITAESDTRNVYVAIDRRSSFKDKTVMRHYVRQIMLPAVFEESQANIDSVIL